MPEITGVLPRSRAAKAGILAGDWLLEINGHPIRDVLDYRFRLAEPTVTLRLHRGPDIIETTIRKGTYDDIGLEFGTPLMDKKQRCENGCLFCFIDQNPPGMRDTIYFKDDDSRLSFLHGNYVTLTNMKDEDIDRIIEMHISPVNVSVHATNPELRVKMMKNKRAGKVLSYLGRLAAAGITLRGQIVLCRGLNDGDELERSMRDLSAYWPAMDSVSVVPVGLTAHRHGLYPLEPFTPEECGAVIRQIDRFNEAFGETHRTDDGSPARIFFASDEFYVKSGTPLPDDAYYGDYLQIDNGVGMLSSLIHEFRSALALAEGVLAELTSPAEKDQNEPTRIPNNVNELLDDLINRSVKLVGKPVSRMSKDDKITAIRFLADSGAMLITKSGDKIAKYFGISKYTLYSYLDSKQGGKNND